ncbi:hypothetical protein M1394_03320 [Candidatus Marsarchaeota archaeon]|nr:hypothetical protein [Candidatus Marsarchaeota archaeon]
MKIDIKSITENRDLREYLLIGALYLIIAMVFFWPLTANITQAVPGGNGGDEYQALWTFWWIGYSLFTLHTSPLFTSYVYYPIGANLISTPLAPIESLLTVPLQVFGLPFAMNFMIFLGFTLSGLFMYILAFHITKNKYGSILAGFIYSFSAIHIAQAFGHLHWINIEFIPLFIFSFLMLIKEKSQKYALLSAASFLLLTFMGDIEQAIMSGIFALIILIYYLFTEERKSILNTRLALLLLEILLIVFILGSPIFIPMASAIKNGVLSTVNAQASTPYTELYSPDLLNFIIPGFMNGLLLPLSSNFFNLVSADTAERTVYAGYTVIALLIIALYAEYKKGNRLKDVRLWLVALVIFFLLSLGPYIQIGGTLTPIPSLYLLYHHIPLLNVLREPGRFDIIVQLILGIFAALGFAELEKRLISSKSFLSKSTNLFIVIGLLLIIEYNTIPLSASQVSNHYGTGYIPKAYSELGSLPGNFSVLILPALPNYVTGAPEKYPGYALYYQTAFKKPLVGGYVGRSNTTQLTYMQNIPLITASSYLEYGEGMSYPSPINYNYSEISNDTLFWLAEYNTAFVSVIRQAYNVSEQESLVSYLYTLLGAPVYESNSTVMFSTNNAITNNVGKFPIYYTNGVWIPGWQYCQNAYSCNVTFGTMWFGEDPRYINVIEPYSRSINMSFSALPLTSNSDVYIYLNGNSYAQIKLGSSEAKYSLRMNLTKGINQIAFYMPNSTYANNATYQYLNFGIENVTFH